MVRYLSIRRPKILSIHSSKAGLIGRLACFIVRQKFLFTVHGWSFSAFQGTNQYYLFFLMEWILSLFTPNFVIISRHDYRIAKFSLNIPARALNFIQNTSTYQYQQNIAEPSSCSVSATPFKILTVGRLDFQKDHKTIILALSKLPKDNSWHYDIVGTGPLLNHLINIVELYGLSDHITFHGFHSDVSSYYVDADLFIHSSFYEGLPLTILEALSYGLPVITSDIPGCREMIIDNVNGFLFPPQHHEFLSSLVIHCYNSPPILNAFRASSRIIYEKLFSQDLFFLQHFSLYGRVDSSLTLNV